MEHIKQRVFDYWEARSESFSKLRMTEYNDDMRLRWEREIERLLPQGEKLNVLDIGTGAGFFPMILAAKGHTVTGIDLSEKMIARAKENMAAVGLEGTFMVMDAENPDFPDETFDVVITRNLTWTLPHTADAYRQWFRVLKKGGVLINFDADYGKEEREKPENLRNHIHKGISEAQAKENDAIVESLDISKYARPEWDMAVLDEIGYVNASVDKTVSSRIYVEENDLYNPVPLFALFAKKPE